MTDELAYKLKMLPESPGCYLMKSEGTIIYVGKAVNLKNRVRQYFHSIDAHAPKVRAMVTRVDDFDVVLCRSNFEALTLECNLIKLHKPFYNIMLRDDKHYPYLRLDQSEAFPRLTLARNMDTGDGAKYFGPYIGATAVRQVLSEVSMLFPLRTCALKLPLAKAKRPCVNYEIGRCCGPCAGLVTGDEYKKHIARAISFLNGDYRELLRDMTKQMNEAAEAMRYEQAALLRDKIMDVSRLMERQHAIQTHDAQQDIIALDAGETDVMAQLMHVRGGRMEGASSYLLENEAGGEPGELMASFVTQYYSESRPVPREVLLEREADDMQALSMWLREKRGGAVTLICPRRGEKRALVDICLKNAHDALVKRQENEKVKKARTEGAMAELQKALGLPAPPRRIEGFDISNTQGVLSVGSMVVFEDGMPNKKAYRHFRIKTVEGANDFASMEEVVGRRFSHGLAERKEREEAGLMPDEGRFSKLPDLVLIDGGPEQLAFARRAMLEAGANVPMFGLAKRFEEIYLPGREEPIRLDKRSEALHLVQRVRDEAHRFGITHHRALRGKASIKSELSEIDGIGPKRQLALLRHFRSAGAALSATYEELMEAPGMNSAAAKAVIAYAKAKKEQS